MRILAVHVQYQQPGGEDASLEAETRMLKARGHTVRKLVIRSEDFVMRGPSHQLKAAVLGDGTLRATIRRELAVSPDVVYLNNWFPWLAPLVDELARVPILAAVRNYRMWCINGLFFRDGADCHLCAGGKEWQGVRHVCYRGVGESIVAAQAVRSVRRTLQGNPQVHFAGVSNHVCEVLVRAGIPASRVHEKPNVVFPSPPVGPGGDDVVFVGRLEPEKGLGQFLDATRSLGCRPVVVGAGSMAGIARGVDYRGELAHTEVLEILGRARVTVVPSLWQEPFGRVAAESLGCGTPIIVSDAGGLRGIGDPACSQVVPAGDTGALALVIQEAMSRPYWATEARQASHRRFLSHYSQEAVAGRLESALRSVLSAA